jgi:hypothetical protein
MTKEKIIKILIDNFLNTSQKYSLLHGWRKLHWIYLITLRMIILQIFVAKIVVCPLDKS